MNPEKLSILFKSQIPDKSDSIETLSQATDLIGAANRDPDIFINPDKFDIDRDNAKKHLAFGYGRHLCLGKHMANMQLSEVYKQILERFPDMHQSDEWKVVPNNFTHSISEMPVAFKPE